MSAAMGRCVSAPDPRSAESGFTLIELVVALAVFSLAALALLRLEGVSLSSTARLQDRLIGQIVARNIAVEALSDPEPPTMGLSNGEEQNAGRLWRWTRRTSAAPGPKLQRIDISVADDHGAAAGTMTVFRPLS
ncbi:MAG: type secretory pathway protein [Sphingomonas bacterium]|jgi:general secretion pathway protein I|nr:type II secretion system minor pseudopilin GspI [Sphingomonas bacterium]MDB5688363.1 type secretory pathway protein [Sphingomonas bacterium]